MKYSRVELAGLMAGSAAAASLMIVLAHFIISVSLVHPEMRHRDVLWWPLWRLWLVRLRCGSWCSTLRVGDPQQPHVSLTLFFFFSSLWKIMNLFVEWALISTFKQHWLIAHTLFALFEWCVDYHLMKMFQIFLFWGISTHRNVIFVVIVTSARNRNEWFYRI